MAASIAKGGAKNFVIGTEIVVYST
ncbi:uncharacterized protein G2W53_009454 [Senna tora]|uniref:Uncharacterized protein n=1 Tax=Senna tora TaxID=362788 RepID=A0A834WYB9_9FABA|nr:uncharacterized protein G2W53_009454 [Senna tora]